MLVFTIFVIQKGLSHLKASFPLFFLLLILQLSWYYVTEFEDFFLNLNIMIISNFVLIYLIFYGCN